MMMTDAKRLAEIRARLAMGVLPSGDQGEFLLRLLDEALAEREWRLIDENTPDKEIVLYFPANRRGFILPETKKVGRPRDFPYRRPTHWMPLPEPPK